MHIYTFLQKTHLQPSPRVDGYKETPRDTLKYIHILKGDRHIHVCLENLLSPVREVDGPCISKVYLDQLIKWTDDGHPRIFLLKLMG